jgi:hypothetical protein
MAKVRTPTELTIWTYQVGFGDCFLLRFTYPNDEHRHVLIDFGTTGKPKGMKANLPLRIAEDIKQKCGDRLDAVVATHRHKDHISGFATTKNGKGSGDIIASLKPKLVIQPWTEHPRARPDARKAPGISQSMRLHGAALERMHDVAGASKELAKRMRKAIDFSVADEIEFLGDDNLKNEPAVRNLAQMGDKTRYVNFGSKSGLESLLPGVKVHVLGPPTLEQSKEIAQQRSRDPDEFWHFWGVQALASKTATAQAGKLFPGAAMESNPQWARWFRQRLTQVHADSTLQLVRILDDAMNNTSVILLFEVNGKRVLFPGDAQAENWLYALSKPRIQKLLRGVDVYKVGHHGSLNATPKKSLWPLLTEKADGKKRRDKFVSLLSTMAGKHGSTTRETEVPRRTLVQALQKASTIVETTKFKAGELCHEHTVRLVRRRGP